MGFRRPALVALAVACVGLPALAKDRPWTHQVADFFRAEAPAPAPSESRTAAVAAFPDLAPARPRAPRDPALELLAVNPYMSDVSAPAAREGAPDPELDREDPYAEQLRLANPYSEELHLTNPYAAARRFDNPYTSRTLAEPPELENPYTASRLGPSRNPARLPAARPAVDDLENPYTARAR